MALVTITGTLTDLGLSALAAFNPEIRFIPHRASFKGAKFLSTKPIVTTPASNGAFSVQLESLEDTRPYTRVTVQARWQVPGSSGEQGWNSVDLIEDFQIPPGGGAIGDIAALDFDPTAVWVSETAPPAPALSTWWLHPLTGDLQEWSP